MSRTSSSLGLVTAVIIAAVALARCTASPDPEPSRSASRSASPSPTASNVAELRIGTDALLLLDASGVTVESLDWYRDSPRGAVTALTAALGAKPKVTDDEPSPDTSTLVGTHYSWPGFAPTCSRCPVSRPTAAPPS